MDSISSHLLEPFTGKGESKVFGILFHIACDVKIGTVHNIRSCDLAVNITDLLGMFL
jgi:hypothetical protein